MTAAAFQATIHGLRTVPSRKVCQIVVEAPIEQLAHIARIAEHGAWVAVARLTEVPAPSSSRVSSSGEREPVSDPGLSTERGHHEKRRFDDMSPAQQAGMLCNDVGFRKYIEEKVTTPCTTVDQAAQIVRDWCGVKSRSALTSENRVWSAFVEEYRLWQIEATFLPA